MNLSPETTLGRYKIFLGRAYEARGMYDQAVSEYNKSAALSGFPPDQLAKMNETYAKSGWKGFVQAVLEMTFGLLSQDRYALC